MNAVIALLLTISCTSLSQIFQKKAAISLRKSREEQTFSSARFFTSPDMLLSVTLLGAGFVFWLFVLVHLDVSSAYPFLSLNLVVVMLLSKAIFSEQSSRHQWLGALLILTGVFLISNGLLA